MNPIPGLHHVTALASDPQQNLDFYAGRLGLRLVKRTVNFDDPATYHLYYGDDAGHPGTILTFFPWPGAPRGRAGTGQTTATSFAVPPASIEWWMDFLARHAIDFGPPELRFGARTLPFLDPDGLALELVELAEPPDPTRRAASAIPPQHAIHGFHGVTLTVSGFERTAAVLTESLGYRATEVEGDRRRFVSATATPDAVVDVICAPELRAGRIAVGRVHHIAFRCADDAEQLAWRERLTHAGLDVTPVMDRQYFHSIYFREPGGVLFELATDAPGFATDEAADRLGASLRLPAWLETRRARIEAALPPLRLPPIASS